MKRPKDSGIANIEFSGLDELKEAAAQFKPPTVMSLFLAGWMGVIRNNASMTAADHEKADAIVKLIDKLAKSGLELSWQAVAAEVMAKHNFTSTEGFLQFLGACGRLTPVLFDDFINQDTVMRSVNFEPM